MGTCISQIKYMYVYAILSGCVILWLTILPSFNVVRFIYISNVTKLSLSSFVYQKIRYIQMLFC